MKTIAIKTQAEFDALPDKFDEFTVIEIRSPQDVWISITRARGSSRVEAWESSRVEAWESSRVVARESSRVVARESSSVEARESSRVEARESSRVVAWESSRVEAWGSSRVVARGSSRVEAWESSRVEAWESSRVVAWESSRVVAWESSRVEARESSRVEAHNNASCYAHSASSLIDLFSFSVCFVLAAAKVTKKSKTATIITPKPKSGPAGWLESEGIEDGESVVLFKRVSKDLLTQEGEKWETKWTIGSVLSHPNWNPKTSECGEGKYHACSRPYFCDEFRAQDGDRYIAIEIKKKDLYAWPNPAYPHKIAFRDGRVLYECDRFGDKI